MLPQYRRGRGTAIPHTPKPRHLWRPLEGNASGEPGRRARGRTPQHPVTQGPGRYARRRRARGRFSPRRPGRGGRAFAGRPHAAKVTANKSHLPPSAPPTPTPFPGPDAPLATPGEEPGLEPTAGPGRVRGGRRRAKPGPGGAAVWRAAATLPPPHNRARARRGR